MTLVVESTSASSGSNLSTLAVNAPSGIQTGDLLLHIVASYNAASGSPSGFTTGLSYQTTNTVNEGVTNFLVSYKVAELADESATTYSVSWGGPLPDDGGAVAMLRVSGWTADVNPIFNSNTTATIYSSSGGPSNISTAVSLTRPNQQLLLMITGVGTTDNSASFSTSNYTITSADPNPTWTELCDVNFNANSNNDTATKQFAVAYATSTDTSSITAYAYDFTEGAGDSYEVGNILLNIVKPLSASADISHLAITPTVESVTGSNTANADISHLAITPSIENITAKSSSDQTQWTNETKPSTTWTNEEK